MGNRIGNLCLCSSGAGEISGRFDNSIAFLSNSHDKALGDSICYVRPDPCRSSGDAFSDDSATFVTFRSVSGATVSANTSSAPSTSLEDTLQHDTALDSSASFESSGSFTSTTMVMMPLQPQHHSPGRFSVGGFVKSPCDDRVLNDGNVEKGYGPVKKLQRSLSHRGCGFQNKTCSRSLKKFLSGSFLSAEKKSILKNNGNANARVSCSTSLSDELRLHSDDDDDDGGGGGCDVLKGCQNLHWAHGRAGEDRLHIVICEDHGWIYVGIYDGFNGPDATDYLLDNLFYAVHEELNGLLCSHNFVSVADTSYMAKPNSLVDSNPLELEEKLVLSVKGNGVVDDGCSSSFNKENHPIGNGNFDLDCVSKKVEGMNSRNSNKEARKKWGLEGGGENMDLEKMMEVNLILEKAKTEADFSHSDVLQALSEALRKTEDAFLKNSDEMIAHNPVLAMMGSCVSVMLMKGEDVYLMNVGDSRAVLATQTGNSLQLTVEHSTHVKEEVHRIWREHPDDPSAVTKGRVKGYLNVTRAFGAGFLKQPRQNNAVLETFKVNYIGDSPYITCCPSLHHHRLSPNDKFLILSSDGLFQYFTNEEAVSKVESFITIFPDRDPAQLLIEEALNRAAKRAGMNFHELLDIPQGERRLYHDDISIVIISLEGKIWRSLV